MDRNPRLFTPRDALRGLSRQRWSAILFFLAVNAVVIAATLLCPRWYESQSKLFVRLGRESVRLDATAALGQGPVVATPNSRESEINSVAQLVGSRLVTEQVVDQLGPQRLLDPTEQSTDESGPGLFSEMLAWLPEGQVSQREQAIIKLGKKLEVEVVPRSNVVAIAYQAESPELAQEVVRGIADTYSKEHVRLNRTAGAYKFLIDQFTEAEEELEQEEAKLKQLRDDTGVVDPVGQRQVLVDRIARLEDDLLEANAGAISAAVEVSEIETALDGLPQTRIVTQTTGAGNEAIDRMREQLYTLQLRQEDLLTKYTNDHFKVQQIDEQIDQAKSILAEEETRRTEKTEGPDTNYVATRLELIRKKPVLAALRAKTDKLTEQLADERTALQTFTADALKVSTMEREVSILEQNYRKYAYNLEQAKIDQSLDSQQMSNIAVAQPATFNAKPVRPRKLLNLILGIVLGTVGGLSLAVLREFLDTRLVSDEQMQEELDLPLLASVPPVAEESVNGHPHRQEVPTHA